VGYQDAYGASLLINYIIQKKFIKANLAIGFKFILIILNKAIIINNFTFKTNKLNNKFNCNGIN